VRFARGMDGPFARAREFPQRRAATSSCSMVARNSASFFGLRTLRKASSARSTALSHEVSRRRPSRVSPTWRMRRLSGFSVRLM